jgi:hypothetical protein
MLRTRNRIGSSTSILYGTGASPINQHTDTNKTADTVRLGRCGVIDWPLAGDSGLSNLTVCTSRKIKRQVCVALTFFFAVHPAPRVVHRVTSHTQRSTMSRRSLSAQAGTQIKLLFY